MTDLERIEAKYEAAPCDVCWYPDPRKLIAKLEAENQRLREALDLVISFIPDGWGMPLGFNQVAQQAREAMNEANHE